MAAATDVSLACLFDPNRTVVLERKPQTHPREPGALSFPGGQRKAGENHIDCLFRELREELWINDADIGRAVQFAKNRKKYDTDGREFEMRYFSVVLNVRPGSVPKNIFFFDFEHALDVLTESRKDILLMAERAIF